MLFYILSQSFVPARLASVRQLTSKFPQADKIFFLGYTQTPLKTELQMIKPIVKVVRTVKSLFRD